MKRGDIVKGKHYYTLCSGAQRYEVAAVVSVEPLSLISLDGDMRWNTTIAPDMVNVIGTLNPALVAKLPPEPKIAYCPGCGVREGRRHESTCVIANRQGAERFGEP